MKEIVVGSRGRKRQRVKWHEKVKQDVVINVTFASNGK